MAYKYYLPVNHPSLPNRQRLDLGETVVLGVGEMVPQENVTHNLTVNSKVIPDETVPPVLL